MTPFESLRLLLTPRADVATFPATEPSTEFIPAGGYKTNLTPSTQSSFVDLDVLGRDSQGYKVRSYFEDLYYRIHFDPLHLNFEDILSTQDREIRLWNAFFEEKEMTDYEAPISVGLTVNEPVVPPYLMQPLGELSYNVTVTLEGPPDFNEAISWVIDGNHYLVPVTGRRVVLWPFGPNWDQTPTESLEWKTDVLTAFNGTEAREALRSKPRRSGAYRMTLTGREIRRYQNLMFGWQNRQFAFPLWYDHCELSQGVAQGAHTVNVDTFSKGFFIGGLIVLMKGAESFEVLAIDRIHEDYLVTRTPIQSVWPAGTPVYPLNLGRLPHVLTAQHLTTNAMTASVEWYASPAATDPGLPATTASELFQGTEVVMKKHNWSAPVTILAEGNYELLDNDIGDFDQVPRPAEPSDITTYGWLLKGRLDIDWFKGLLKRLQGRKNVVYIPTWMPDFRLTSAVPLGSPELVVENTLFTRMVGASAEKRNVIMIRMRNGDQFFREIQATNEEGLNERVTVDSPFPYQFGPDDVVMISLVKLSRLEQDGVTINYRTTHTATVDVTFRTVVK